MEALLVIAGAGLVVVGVVGCVLPVLPGPPLSFAGLLLLWWARGWDAGSFGVTTVVVLGGLSVLVTVLDFVLPAWGARRYGASKAGVWGSVLGMIVGIFFFPPFGMLAGAFLGALGGELLVGKDGDEAGRAAWGVFVGTVAGIGLKLAVSLATAVVYVIEVF
jgi:uncharacterized protein YqgC (DUF456 family)